MAPAFEPQSLKNNPLTSDTPYVMHLTSRHDFGPVYSHRYFVCPEDLEEDWIELTLMYVYCLFALRVFRQKRVWGYIFRATNSSKNKPCTQETFRIHANINERQWFAQGDPFKLKAEKWDLKCAQDKRFFRLTLRPNLNMRGSLPAHSPQPLPAQLAGFQATTTPARLEYSCTGHDSGYGSGTASSSYATETYGGLQARATPAPLEYTYTALDSGYGSRVVPANYAAETCGGIQGRCFPSHIEYSRNEGERHHVEYGSGAATYVAEESPSQIGYPHKCYDSEYGSGAITSYAAEPYDACQDYSQESYFGQWRGRESGYVCEEPEEAVEIKQVEF
jgi:hypothetical protein